MAGKRLVKADKVSIHNTVLEKAAEPRLEELMIRENALAMAVYKSIVKGHERGISSMPAGFFLENDDIGVTLFSTVKTEKSDKNATYYKRACLQTPYRSEYKTPSLGRYYSGENMSLGKSVRMPNQTAHASTRLLLTSYVGGEIKTLIEDHEKLFNDLKRLSETVLAALESCTTVKKLIENYPELKPYAPADIANTSLAVPHGKIEDLINCTKKDECKKARKPRNPNAAISL